MKASFSGNAIKTLIFQIVISLLGMCSSVILARTLGPDGMGEYVLVSLLASFLVYFSTLGLGQASVFYLGKGIFNEKEIFGHSILLVAILSVIAVSIGVVVVNWFGANIFQGIHRELIIFGLFLVPCQLLFGFIGFTFLGKQQISYHNMSQLFRIVVMLFSVVAFMLWFGLEVKKVLLAEITAFLLTSIFMFVAARNLVGGMSIRLNINYIRGLLKYGLVVYTGSLLVFIHYRLDMFLVNLFLGPAMVGLYALSAGLSEKLSLLSNAIATVLFPRISSETDLNAIGEFTPLVLRSVLLIVIGTSVFLELVSHWIITIIYSQAYAGSVKPFQILLLGTISLSGWSILDSDFKGRGIPIWGTVTSAISVIVNVSLNVAWIPSYGIVGAALASTVSYTVSFICALIVYCRLLNKNIFDVIIPKRSDFRVYGQLVKKMTSALY